MIRVTEQSTVPAEKRSSVLLVPSHNGLSSIDRIQMYKPPDRVALARGIHEVRENVPFRILATNFSEKVCTTP